MSKLNTVKKQSRITITVNLYLEPNTLVPGPHILTKAINTGLRRHWELSGVSVGSTKVSKPVEYRKR